MSESRDTCVELLKESCISLFDAYDIVVEPVTRDETGDQKMLLGFIGFAHSNLRGALAITSSQALLDETAQGACPKDWIGELANQLLGRLKNKLLSYDVVLQMSTPIAMSGYALSIAGDPASVEDIYFSTPYGPLHLHLDLELSVGFVLERVSSVADEMMDEGELLFF